MGNNTGTSSFPFWSRSPLLLPSASTSPAPWFRCRLCVPPSFAYRSVILMLETQDVRDRVLDRGLPGRQAAATTKFDSSLYRGSRTLIDTLSKSFVSTRCISNPIALPRPRQTRAPYSKRSYPKWPGSETLASSQRCLAGSLSDKVLVFIASLAQREYCLE